jgi:hypothetical protein
MKPLRRFLFFLASALSIISCSQPNTITVGTLLKELTNRDAKAEYPLPEYTCKQFSSYDRATVNPNDKSWFANWDRSMFVRIDTVGTQKQYVMMDTDGPGAIVRFWMTFGGEHPGEGTLQIFLDNDSVPVITGNPFDILSRGKLVGPPLSMSVPDSAKFKMRGHNLYFPVPYATHCKIVYISDNIKDLGAKTGGEAVYYNIDYRTYKKGTNVVTFSNSELEKYQKTLKITQDKLTNRALTLPDNTEKTLFDGTIEKGKSKEISFNKSQSAIRVISLKLKAVKLEQALRSTILEITFDGKMTVRCPVGDFFGTGYQIRPVNTYYTKVANDSTLSCFWVMPYQKKCTLTFRNEGDQDLEITRGKIVTAPYNWDNRTMYFSAAWEQYTHLKTGEMKSQEGDGMPFDMHYLDLKGKGVYIGDGICVYNTVYAWWGEGDEKIYVDNDDFPSFVGTGTEDYYGYAWCRPERFSNHPFIGQPDGSGNFVPGYSVNLRQRGLDGIPFTKAFRFDMEMWHWTRAIINFSHVNYWYILPADAINVPFNLKEAAEPVALKREDIVSPWVTNEKIEAENLILKNKTGGSFYYSNNVNAGWSGNVQLVWAHAKPSDKLHLAFMSKNENTVQMTIHYSAGKEYGRFKISTNNKNDTQVNARRPNAQHEKMVIRGIHVLKGENTMTITALPSSENKETKVGIDFIKLN